MNYLFFRIMVIVICVTTGWVLWSCTTEADVSEDYEDDE